MKSRWAFRKADRDSIIILIIVIIVSIVLFPFLAEKKDRKDDATNNRNIHRKGEQHNEFYAQQGDNDGASPATPKCELFPFDPNTADSIQLLRLGLQPWQVRSIYKYRSKGGRFRKKEDFARLYGLTLEKYQQLAPYIRIPEEKMAADYVKSVSNVTFEKRPVEVRIDKTSGERKLRYGETVDINTADTSELKRIPGIGSYYARRIVELRKKMQTFTSKEDLIMYIRNFPETALNYMSVSNNFPRLHINKVSQKELSKHPLFNYTQARDVIALRRTSGKISSMEDLSLIPSFTATQLKRLESYIIFD